jgi:hypothetical protein
MDFKMRMAFIFQPYLWVSLLGLFAAYGQYTYFENKITALSGIVIFVINLANYLSMLIRKAIVIRNFLTLIVILGYCSMAGVGSINLDLGAIVGSIMAIFLLVACALDYSETQKIVQNTKFEETLQHKPELTIYIKNELEMLSQRYYYKSFYKLYTYLNNGIFFDESGVKGTKISYLDVEAYLENTMISMKDFNADNLKTIEMLKI